MKTNQLPPRAVRARRMFVATTMGQSIAHGALGAVYTLALIEKGFGTEVLMYVNACFYLFVSLFEIPTGVYADIRGRKESCVLGWFIQAVAFYCYAFATSFVACVASEALFALGMSLVSGASRAWLSDELEGCADRSEIRAKATRTANASALALSIACAYAAVTLMRMYGNAAPYLIGFVVMTITTISGHAAMRRDTPTQTIGHVHPFQVYKQSAQAGWHAYRGSASLRNLFAIMCVYNLTFMAPNMFWQLMYKDLLPSGGGIVITHLVIKATFLAGAVLATVAATATIRSLASCQVCTGLALACAGITATLGSPITLWLSLLAFGIHEIGRGWFDPVRADFVDRSVDETGRAENGAVLRSIDSIVSHVGGLLGLVASGYLQRYLDPATTVAVSGCILVANGTLGIIRSK